MAYAQATLTDVNASNVLAGVIDGLLTTAGWSTVETLTPSGNFRNRVYKSSGGSNLCGYDWYIAVTWTVVGTQYYVEVWAGTLYDSGTHILGGICAGSQLLANTAIQVAGLDTNPAGYYGLSTLNMSTHVPSSTTKTIVTTSRANTNVNDAPGFQTIIPSSAFGYWASVTLDHFALFTSVGVNFQNAVYSTLILDGDYAASSLYTPTPIVCWNTLSFELSASLKGVTLGTNSYRTTHASYSGPVGSLLPALSDEYDVAYAWKPYVYLDYLVGGAAGADPYAGTQFNGRVLIGSTPDIYLVFGGSLGDTVTISAATYVLTGPLVGSGVANLVPTVAVLVE